RAVRSGAAWRAAGPARHLYALEVTDAVPETIEASLQLAESALVGLGVPMGAVIASVHERREAVRRELQAASGGAGPFTEQGRHRVRTARRRDREGELLKIISWTICSRLIPSHPLSEPATRPVQSALAASRHFASSHGIA